MELLHKTTTDRHGRLIVHCAESDCTSRLMIDPSGREADRLNGWTFSFSGGFRCPLHSSLGDPTLHHPQWKFGRMKIAQKRRLFAQRLNAYRRWIQEEAERLKSLPAGRRQAVAHRRASALTRAHHRRMDRLDDQ